MARPDPDGQALWRRVAATVTPLRGRSAQAEAPSAAPSPMIAPARIANPSPPRPAAAARRPGETLDATWDRRLAHGLVAPDRAIDLHGRSLAQAHALLERVLGEAAADGARLLLVVTGKLRTGDPNGRGAIRASVGDWLSASPHAGRIAAVRAAHRRHGGAGAIYLVLRRIR